MTDLEPITETGRPWEEWGPQEQRENLKRAIGDELYQWLEVNMKPKVIRPHKDVLKAMGLRTFRQYKQLKREQLAILIEDFYRFWESSVYIPYAEKLTLGMWDTFKDLKKALSQKEWGK